MPKSSIVRKCVRRVFFFIQTGIYLIAAKKKELILCLHKSVHGWFWHCCQTLISSSTFFMWYLPLLKLIRSLWNGFSLLVGFFFFFILWFVYRFVHHLCKCSFPCEMILLRGTTIKQSASIHIISVEWTQLQSAALPSSIIQLNVRKQQQHRRDGRTKTTVCVYVNNRSDSFGSLWQIS